MARAKVWPESRRCRRRGDCLSIDGHYGRCLVRIAGQLCWEDGERAIGASSTSFSTRSGLPVSSEEGTTRPGGQLSMFSRGR